MIRIVNGPGGGAGGDHDPCVMDFVIYHTHGFTTNSVDINHTHQFNVNTGGETGHTHGFSGGDTGVQSADHTHSFTKAVAWSNNAGGGGGGGNVQNQGGTAVSLGQSVSHVHSVAGTIGGSTGHIHNVAGGTAGMDQNNVHGHTGTTDPSGGGAWNARFFNAIVCQYVGG